MLDITRVLPETLSLGSESNSCAPSLNQVNIGAVLPMAEHNKVRDWPELITTVEGVIVGTPAMKSIRYTEDFVKLN